MSVIKYICEKVFVTTFALTLLITSNLFATEEKIQKALGKLTLNKTTIVIAHRLSTILNSDKIYVVNQGRIIDSGNHKDLLSTSSVYKNFYERQIKQN